MAGPFSLSCPCPTPLPLSPAPQVDTYVACGKLGPPSSVRRLLAARLMLLTHRPAKVLQSVDMLLTCFTQDEMQNLPARTGG